MRNLILFESFSDKLNEQSYWDQFPAKDGWIMRTTGGGFTDTDSVIRTNDPNYDAGFRKFPLIGQILHIFINDETGDVGITARFKDEEGNATVEKFVPQDLKLA